MPYFNKFYTNKTTNIVNNVNVSRGIDTSFLKVFGILISLLLFIGVFRIIFNGEDISLYRLILFFQNMPQIPTDWIVNFAKLKEGLITADMGFVQWLADFINWLTGAFIDITSFAMYVSVGFGNLIVFAGYIVAFLFS